MEEVIIDEETFLASFGEYQYRLAKKYLAAWELNSQIKNSSEIARKLHHPKRTIAEWLTRNKTPRAIRALNFLKSIKLMPLKESNSREFILFTELSAFLFGDGHLMKHLGAFTFFGQKADLEFIALKLETFYGLKPKISRFYSNSTVTKIINGRIIEHHSKGRCWRLDVNSSPLARLFYLGGVPAGDKVFNSTRVPEWIINGSKEIKRYFLSVLFGNELQCPYIRAKNAFNSPKFGLHKIENKKEDLKAFLSQIKELVDEFGISSSQIALDNYRTIRKDGNKSLKLQFSIDSHSPNVLCLFRELPFKYAKEKQKRFAKNIKLFLQNSQHLKFEWQLYERVMQMHAQGIGRRKIFKQLNLHKKYFYRINAWIHYGQRPLYYNKRNLFS